MIRKIIKKITHPILKGSTQRFFEKPRPFTYDGIEVMVMPGVFPPHYTLSTKILLEYLKTLDIKGETLLELGCGSGIIALYAASKGAIVSASDINDKALSALMEASMKNDLSIKIIASDLFNNIYDDTFDLVIINPPYYPKQPNDVQEKAWFCGSDFEYFKNLFSQLSQRRDREVVMILSQDCDINKIKSLANEHGLGLMAIVERNLTVEKNFIFRVCKNQ